jgi:hypothetical protein
MGKWATYRRRGGGTVPPLDAPVLHLVAVEDLEWDWDGPDPDRWEIDNSPFEVGPWDESEMVPGTDRAFGPVVPDFWWSIIGIDSIGNPVTSRSNAVFRAP